MMWPTIGETLHALIKALWAGVQILITLVVIVILGVAGSTKE